MFLRKTISYTLILILLSFLINGCGVRETKTQLNPDGPRQNQQFGNSEEVDEAPHAKTVDKLNGTYLVMIENLSMARPQAGLDKADTVYEMLTEGGITRFMAVYSTYSVDKIGPIRSTRVDFVELALAYNSPYVYAGGHQVALNLIPKLGIQSLNQIEGRMTPYFWRSKDRKMPHNLYSSSELIKKGIENYSYNLGRLDNFALGTMFSGNPISEITIRYYDTVTYKYMDGAYRRYINGEPHLLENGQVIAPANLVVLLANHRPYAPGEERLKIDIIGKGKAFFFIDGMVYEGNWERPTARDFFIFTTADGESMLFRHGQVWINIVPNEKGRVEFK